MSDDWSVGSEKSAMRLTNPKAALEKLYEFRDLVEMQLAGVATEQRPPISLDAECLVHLQ